MTDRQKKQRLGKLADQIAKAEQEDHAARRQAAMEQLEREFAGDAA